MTLIEVKKGILDLMKTIYPTEQYKYYAKTVNEGYNSPAFFVRLKPILIQNGNKWRENHYAVYITYFQKVLDEADVYRKVEELEDLFGKYIRINDRALDVTDISFDYLGTDQNILEMTFNIEWYENTVKETNDTLAESVDINTFKEE